MPRCTLLGTAAALSTADRDNTALVFVSDASVLLVDCPGGAYAKLLRAGVAPARLTHLLLTHQHTDHTHGLPGLLQSLWLGGRTAPLPLLGLAEVQALADRALAAFTPFRSDASVLLVDCPGGAYAKLLRAGVAPARLTHLLLTHQHTDHTHGLPGLLQSLWLGGRTAPLPLLGLAEVQALADRALAAFTPF